MCGYFGRPVEAEPVELGESAERAEEAVEPAAAVAVAAGWSRCGAGGAAVTASGPAPAVVRCR